LLAEYLHRSARYSAVQYETFASSERFFAWVSQLRKRGTVRVVLFDPAGQMMTSEELAGGIDHAGIAGVQQLVMAVGPADGWSEEDRKAAQQIISFGRITLPHELALAVAAEQIYRALTILTGHPYHSGH
jgi:23S rRNA (pseudouridine1915-N3)-methyltransferase